MTRIREMAADELQAAISAIRDGGWGDRTRELTFYAAHPSMTVLVAEQNGTIVGTTVVIASMGIGWVGLVFVSPAERGRGLGSDLTRAGLARLDALGCRSVLLAASDMGERIYERLGFVAEGAYAVMRGAAADAMPVGVRRLTADDLAAVCALDRDATGEDRAHVLRMMHAGWVAELDGKVAGFALETPWGRWPIVAADAPSGIRLMETVRAQSEHEVQMLVPVQNAAAMAHLAAAGFSELRRLPRMRLGEPVAWHPEQVFALFNFALG